MESLTTTAFRYTDLGVYSCDASDLCLPPGAWPEVIHTVINKRPYQLIRNTRKLDKNGDLAYVNYLPSDGGQMRFIVWND